LALARKFSPFAVYHVFFPFGTSQPLFLPVGSAVPSPPGCLNTFTPADVFHPSLPFVLQNLVQTGSCLFFFSFFLVPPAKRRNSRVKKDSRTRLGCLFRTSLSLPWDLLYIFIVRFSLCMSDFRSLAAFLYRSSRPSCTCPFSWLLFFRGILRKRHLVGLHGDFSRTVFFSSFSRIACLVLYPRLNGTLSALGPAGGVPLPVRLISCPELLVAAPLSR